MTINLRRKEGFRTPAWKGTSSAIKSISDVFRIQKMQYEGGSLEGLKVVHVDRLNAKLSIIKFVRSLRHLVSESVYSRKCFKN